MSNAVVLDRAATFAPSVGYIGIWLSGASIQDFVAILTGVLVVCQIIKIGLEFKDRVAKRKESNKCPSKVE